MEPKHAAIARTAKDGSRADGRHGGRVHALDGLRGVAAMVVLVHHCLLASAPRLAGAYFTPHMELGRWRSEPTPVRGTLEWLITYTPLHVFWAGPEFVVVFFVLSGFVLTLPVARGGRMRIASYYPTRMLRLYLPVWGALVLAAWMHLAVSHGVLPGASWWLNSHVLELSWEGLKVDALLGSHAGDWAFTTVLWSLHWEVLFSLLLPVLLLIPFGMRLVRLALALACLALLRYGQNQTAVELAPFVLGMLLAYERDAIELLAVRLRGRSPGKLAVKLALLGACVCWLSADWWVPDPSTAPVLIALGACVAVFCALALGSARALLQAGSTQWLGKRAFSLYLVHEPLVVALAFAFAGRLAPVPFTLTAGAASVGLCALFFRYAEAPFHRLARQWGAECGRRLAALGPSLAARGLLHRPT